MGARADRLTRRHPITHGPLDLVATTFPLRQGIDDPTMRVAGGEVWRALRTSEGPATLHLRVDRDELVSAAAGPGATAALELAPAIAGLHDDPTALHPVDRAVAEARRRSPGLRLTSATPVSEAIIWVVLAQKVVGLDARAAYRALVRQHPEPSPGPEPLLLPPDPRRLAATPYWVFHQCNVEMRRARVVIDAARRSTVLDALIHLDPVEARLRLQSLPGIGAWTAAEVTAVSHGDPDAVPLGDYHVPHAVVHALSGVARGDDERMLELLEPYRGQRGRVIRLLMSGGRGAPRFGPRLARQDIRRR